MLKGIDISNWQKDIASFGDDVDFVIVKATEGKSYVDPACNKLYQLAKRCGKLLGVYHFARPDNNDAVTEAEFFVKNINGYLNEAILVLDFERNMYNVSWAKAFLDRVKELTGIKPLLYISRSPVNQYDYSSIANADYGLWVADYGKNNGQENVFPAVKYWKNVAIWQYTSNGKIKGYNGNIDKNNFYGDEKMWQKYANATTQKNEQIQNNTGGDYDMKSYKNGSTVEPIYQDSNCTNKIGSLNPDEACDCLGEFTNGKNEKVAVVLYTIDNSNPANRKVGFAKYTGGIGK